MRKKIAHSDQINAHSDFAFFLRIVTLRIVTCYATRRLTENNSVKCPSKKNSVKRLSVKRLDPKS